MKNKIAWRPHKHGDRKGRHYYTTLLARFTCIVVTTLAVAMLSLNITVRCAMR
jgi:hypothetical protein